MFLTIWKIIKKVKLKMMNKKFRENEKTPFFNFILFIFKSFAWEYFPVFCYNYLVIRLFPIQNHFPVSKPFFIQSDMLCSYFFIKFSFYFGNAVIHNNISWHNCWIWYNPFSNRWAAYQCSKTQNYHYFFYFSIH